MEWFIYAFRWHSHFRNFQGAPKSAVSICIQNNERMTVQIKDVEINIFIVSEGKPSIVYKFRSTKIVQIW